MEELILTAHATVVIAERGIESAWIHRVVECPERVEDDVDSELVHALGRIAEHGDLVLRVVRSRSLPPRIVTVYFDRTMRGKL